MIANEVISETIYTYTGCVSHMQCNRPVHQTKPHAFFFTLISLSRGQFLSFPFSVIFQLITSFHNFQGHKIKYALSVWIQKRTFKADLPLATLVLGGGRLP